MDAKYGLTANGFNRKRLPEIINSINNRVSDKLGIQIETGSNSIFGQLHGIYAYEIADLWELAENIYNAMYPHSASGTSLTNAAALTAIKPIAAEQTTVLCTVTGNDGVLIPSGVQVQDKQSKTYSLIADTYITASKAIAISLTIDNVATGTEFSITIDGLAKSYTALANDNVSTIISAIIAQFNLSDKTLILNNNVLTISANNKRNAMAVSAHGFTIKNVSSTANFICDTYGDIDPGIGNITTIINAISGWQSVNNELPAVVGRHDETDTELRQRWSKSVYKKASAMVEAIQANVYENVAGVTACAVYENTSDVEDADGRPPHSVEVVAEGGLEDEIAKEIFTYKAAGIDTFGTVTKNVLDAVGVSHIINFNRPLKVPIWLKAVVTKNNESAWAENTLNEVKDLLLTAGNAYKVGEDVILQRFLGNIYTNTTGIGFIQLTATEGETPGTYTDRNITITPRQVATFDISRIEVSIND